MSSSRQIAQRLPSQYIAALQIKTMSTLQLSRRDVVSSSARDDSHPQAIRHRQVFASCSALRQLNDPKATVQAHDGRRGMWEIVECRALTLLSHSEVCPLFPNSRIPPTVHSTTMHVRMLAVTLLLRRPSHGCRIKVFDTASVADGWLSSAQLGLSRKAVTPLNGTAVRAAIPTKSSVQPTIESLHMGVFELRCDDRMQRSAHESVDQWSISGLRQVTFTLARCLPTIDRLEQIQDVFATRQPR
ncbi:hypothetical protein C8F01DRAFT_1150053 [Mycena amicta]|nr:hypothetical protein C8F01DRAFT_1150053 [Mycena amicta]